MFCAKCGFQMEQESAFCRKCGHAAPQVDGQAQGEIGAEATSESSAAGVGRPATTQSSEVRTSGLAIASLVLGLLWVGGIGALLALVFGYSARRQIRQSSSSISGAGMAMAGIVLGWIGMLALVASALVFVTAPGPPLSYQASYKLGQAWGNLGELDTNCSSDIQFALTGNLGAGNAPSNVNRQAWINGCLDAFG